MKNSFLFTLCTMLFLASCIKDEKLEITMKQSGSLSVTIKDNAGSPITGATVSLTTYGTSFSADDFATSVEFSSNLFGYYLYNEDDGEIFYSDSTLRADGFDYMRAYQGTGDAFSVFDDGVYRTWSDNEYILAWEDWAGGGDQDWQDFVVMVESVETAPVPEPATMLLFGTGLAGLAGLRRKKSKKS